MREDGWRRRVRRARLSWCCLVLGGLAVGQWAGADGGAGEVARQIECLSSQEATTRAEAARRLGRMGGRAAPAAPALIRLLTGHPAPRYKGSIPMYSPAWEANEALASIGKPAVPHLLRALDDANMTIRARAAGVLGRIGDAQARAKLLALLKDGAPTVRAHAALALGRMGVQSLEPLIAAAKDPHPLVQSYALVGLRLGKDPRAVVSSGTT